MLQRGDWVDLCLLGVGYMVEVEELLQKRQFPDF